MAVGPGLGSRSGGRKPKRLGRRCVRHPARRLDRRLAGAGPRGSAQEPLGQRDSNRLVRQVRCAFGMTPPGKRLPVRTEDRCGLTVPDSADAPPTDDPVRTPPALLPDGLPGGSATCWGRIAKPKYLFTVDGGLVALTRSSHSSRSRTSRCGKACPSPVRPGPFRVRGARRSLSGPLSRRRRRPIPDTRPPGRRRG